MFERLARVARSFSKPSWRGAVRQLRLGFTLFEAFGRSFADAAMDLLASIGMSQESAADDAEAAGGGEQQAMPCDAGSSDEEAEGSKPSGGKAASRENPQRKTPNECFGCCRVFGQSACYLDPSLKVRWRHPSGVGLACQDCHNVHTTMYKSEPIPFFAEWLKTDPSREMDWKLALLAYFMLKYESPGSLHEREPAIVAKKASLRWLFDLVGFDLADVVAIPLETLVQKSSSFEALRGSWGGERVVSVCGTEGVRLAAVVPATAPGLSDAFGSGARAFGQANMFRPKVVSTSAGADARLLEAAGSALPRPALEGRPSLLALTDAGSPQGADHRCKFAAKLAVLSKRVKDLFCVFQSPHWKKIAKDAAFTKPRGQFATLKGNASTEGKKSVTDEAEKYDDLLSLTKS
ncbi:MAG TPA: hypothetical protein EYP98_20420, partial [Planctomycetes bacterium]|nr:hypothetical protein [Planctomycetota bacterium]